MSESLQNHWREGYESGIRVGQAQIIAAFCKMVHVQTGERLLVEPLDPPLDAVERRKLLTILRGETDE